MSRKYSTLSLNKGLQPILSDVNRFVNTILFHKLPYRDSRRYTKAPGYKKCRSAANRLPALQFYDDGCCYCCCRHCGFG